MTRWDLVYKWSDPKTQSLVDEVTSALENCDRKLHEAEARAASPSPAVTEALREAWERVEPFIEVTSGLTEAQIAWEEWERALAAVPAPSPAVAPLDVERLVRAVELSRNHDRDPSHQSRLCLCRMEAKQIAANYASPQAASPGEGEPA